MKLKTYQAQSMSDALAKVKKDLGRDAVILHTRTLKRGGVLGLGARPVVEITATADRKVMSLRKANAGNDGGTTAQRAPNSEPKSEKSRSAVLEQPSTFTSDSMIRREVGEIRTMVRDLLKRTERSEHPEVPAELIDHYSSLIGQDVAAELAVQLLDRVKQRLADSDTGSAEVVRAELCSALSEMLPSAAPMELNAIGRPTKVAMVGPTGVGKTTTIAKLAANMKLREGRKVGLITIDSYRIAAVEQLKTYAQILKVPLIPVLSPDELEKALKRMNDLDLVLIDTAGRSQKDELRMGELREFLRVAAPDQIHLVLSTTSREETIREAIEKFKVLGAERLIFTKLDESVGFGVILNVLKSVDMRLSYLTNGQSVPDDIEVGSASRVAQLIVESVSDKAVIAGC